MKKYFWKLMLIELKKIWTLRVIIFVACIALFVFGAIFLPYYFGFITMISTLQALNINSILISAFSTIIPLLAIIFGTGIIQKDIENNWIRTITSRPISKELFLTSKLSAMLVSALIIILLIATIPILFFVFFSEFVIEISIIKVLLIHVFYLLEFLLYMGICSWLSCWLPSFVNSIILAIWLLSDNILKTFIDAIFWDKNWALILKDFYFPSGFSEAIQIITNSDKIPYQEICWGFAGLFGFLALAYWNLTIIKIDKGSN